MKPTNSSFWKNVIKIWPKIEEKCFWSTGNGYIVDAWNERWIDSGIKISYLNLNIPIQLRETVVIDLLNEEPKWKWELLNQWLPGEILNRIRVMFLVVRMQAQMCE